MVRKHNNKRKHHILAHIFNVFSLLNHKIRQNNLQFKKTAVEKYKSKATGVELF